MGCVYLGVAGPSVYGANGTRSGADGTLLIGNAGPGYWVRSVSE